MVLVRPGSVGLNGEGRIEQKYPLRSPTIEIAADRSLEAKILADLPEDVLQRGWQFNSIGDRETQSVRLPGTVVRILTKDDHSSQVKWRLVKCMKDESGGREYLTGGILLPDKIGQFQKIGLIKLFGQTFTFTGGEITGEFLMSLGYLPGAHCPTCAVYKKIAALKGRGC